MRYRTLLFFEVDLEKIVPSLLAMAGYGAICVGMTRQFVFSFFLSLTFRAVIAVDLPAGGELLTSAPAVQASANPSVGKVQSLPAGQRITITTPEKAYAAQFTAPVPGPVAKHERICAIIKARIVTRCGVW